MKIELVKTDLLQIEAELVIVNLFKGVEKPLGATKVLDDYLEGMISKLISNQELKGDLGEIKVLYPQGKKFSKVIIVGLGAKEEFDLEKVRYAHGVVIKEARKGKIKKAATVVTGAGIGGLQPQGCAQAATEGTLLGFYSYQEHLSQRKDSALNHFVFVENDAEKYDEIATGIEIGKSMAQGCNLARDLVNSPSNFLTPQIFAQIAGALAEKLGLHYQILTVPDLEQEKMGLLLGVGQGSTAEPLLIKIDYVAPSTKTIALVGKGLTFDAGGISLKPSKGMEAMKSDMGGGAAVLGAMSIIADLKPKINVSAYIPCAENLPSGTAIKPGDVLKSRQGKTVEVINTDAEGRLILADAVNYAQTCGADEIIDVATLTGAAVVALGTGVYSALFSDNEKLKQKLLHASQLSGEKLWPMPCDNEYKELYKGTISDLKNTGPREGGAITGALFIREFINNAAWAHLDIAPTALDQKDQGYKLKGASGVGARTLAQVALLSAEE